VTCHITQQVPGAVWVHLGIAHDGALLKQQI
jgi:hypothetical protein